MNEEEEVTIKKSVSCVLMLLIGVVISLLVASGSGATVPGDVAQISGTFGISGFTGSSDPSYNPCSSLTAGSEGWWVSADGNIVASGTDGSPSCSSTQSPDSANPGSYRYDYTFTYSASDGYTVPANSGGSTIHLALAFHTAGNVVSSLDVQVDNPPPPTTQTAGTTTTDTSTVTTTTDAQTPAPAPAIQIQTVIQQTDTSDIQAQIAGLQAQIDELRAELSQLKTILQTWPGLDPGLLAEILALS